ncbi:MAG: PAS domain S-box protein [Bacillota bacterium]
MKDKLLKTKKRENDFILNEGYSIIEENNDKTFASDFYIVGIGASYKDIDYLKQFFKSFHSDVKTAFIIVQPFNTQNNDSILEGLSEVAHFKIVEITDGMTVEPGSIYIGSTLHAVIYSGGRLLLIDKSHSAEFQSAIDEFLYSLARERGDKSMAIMFTGCGQEGAAGCRAVKKMGGVVVVQDCEAALDGKADRREVFTGICDYILPTDKIPEELFKCLELFMPDSQGISSTLIYDTDEIILRLYDTLNRYCGVDFIHFRQNFILFNVEKRMRINRVESLKSYLSLLEQDRGEIKLLCKSLLIGTTRFFRDSDAFKVLEQNIIPDILGKRSTDSPVRIWVVGCSTGEEAYSVAILFKEYMIRVQRNFDVKIFATDVDINAIEHASKGSYPESIMEDVTLERLSRFFIKRDNKYQVTRQIRDMVEFSCHNVIDNPPYYKIDLISCRNLLLYYNPEVQKKVISLFQFSLNREGFLFLGVGENADEFNNFFSTCDNKWNIYRCIGVNKRRAIDNLSIRTMEVDLNRYKGEGDFSNKNTQLEEINAKLIKEYMSPCIVFNQKGEILQVCGTANKFFGLKDDMSVSNLSGVLHENLASALNSALYRLKKQKNCIVYNCIQISMEDNQYSINLVIKRFEAGGSSQLFIAILEEVKVEKLNSPKISSDTSGNLHLTEFNKDIINFFNNTNTGTILLDNDLCIRAFTPAVTREINLIKHDIGRPLSHITHNLLNEDLKESAMEVLESNTSKEKEVQSAGGNWYIVKYYPYSTINNEVISIVIVLIDITGIKKAQDKLTRLSYAIDQSSTIVMIMNLESRVEYVNLRFLQLTGYSYKEVCGKELKFLKPFTNNEEYYKYIGDSISSGKEWKGEIYYKNEKSREFWLSTAVTPVRSTDGTIAHFIAVMEDITDRKSMIEALKNSEEKFRQLFDNTSDAIFIYSFNAKGMPGRIDDVNKTACEALGYAKDELLTMTQYDIIAEEYISEIPKINQRLLAQDYDTYEIYYTCKSGNKIPLEINSHIFLFNGERYALTTARDITRRKKYEEGLRRSRERYKQLVQNSPFAILIIKQGRILFTNKSALKLLGTKNAIETIGQSIDKYFNNLDEKRLMEIYSADAGVNGELASPIEDRILRPDGTEGYVEITGMPFWFEGEKTVLMMVRDISSQKHAEDLEKDIEKKNRLLNETLEYDTLKTEFFSSLSHEFRTPLNVIIGTLQLLNMYLRESVISDSSNKVSKYTCIIKHNCYRLLRLVNNMIDITSIDIGLLQVNLQNCDIVNIIENITLSVAKYIEVKGISVVFDTNVEEKFIACDRDKIECIILNLLSNAVKCTKSGDSISVGIHDEGENLRIYVEDTGVGIPEDKLGIVFERFRQVDKTLTRKHEGSGIGLFLVKSLVEMHDGKISVESEYGKGTKFIIEIPARLVDTQNNSERKKIESMAEDLERIYIEFSDIDI